MLAEPVTPGALAAARGALSGGWWPTRPVRRADGVIILALCKARPVLAAVAHRGTLKLSWGPGEPWAKLMNHRSGDGDQEADQRRSAALIGLIIILALAIAGVWLVRELRQKSALEDCLMSGRTNCAPIEAPSRR
jgi:hypothetical protein